MRSRVEKGDVLGWTPPEIKYAKFKFKDKKKKPLSIHQAKSYCYNYCQNDLTNTHHLNIFNNMVDISISHESNTHNQAIIEHVCQKKIARSSLDSPVIIRRGATRQLKRCTWMWGSSTSSTRNSKEN